MQPPTTCPLQPPTTCPLQPLVELVELSISQPRMSQPFKRQTQNNKVVRTQQPVFEYL